LIATLIVLAFAMNTDASDETARTLTFTTIVIGNLGLILVNRSWQHTILATLPSRNRALWWVIGGAFSFLVLALILPFMREVFHFAPITPAQFTLCVLAGVGSVIWFEGYKLWQRR
jgi:Ca2+-transporting ATPase